MNVMDYILGIFSNPFFIIFSGMAVLFSLVLFFYTVFLVTKGVIPVWYRIGIGLSKRKIAIFAEQEFDSLNSMILDSNIFTKTISKVFYI